MSNKTNIEEDIKKVKHLLTHKYILNDEDINRVWNILADRERLEKETENQKYIIQQKDLEMLDLKDSKCLVKRYFKLKDNNGELQAKANKYDSLVEKIKRYCEKTIKQINGGSTVSMRSILKDILELLDTEQIKKEV